MDLQVRSLPTSTDLLICSTSQSNKFAYMNFANASLPSVACRSVNFLATLSLPTWILWVDKASIRS
uniref:Uncharacterized protein MANES_15G083100 n=1 Tax=Rhizophora mucronata TaxID=61149 RepID=A0A2P2M4N6_RHIMU